MWCGQTWLGPLFAELGTLAFFAGTGYKFRPTADNPYLRVRQNDDDDNDEEFGLDGAGSDDDGVCLEMTSKATPASDAKREAV